MANVAAPRNGIPIGTARVGGQTVSVEVHPEYLRWFESLVFRLGGITGASATDLSLSAFEDAGIEENKHAVLRVSDDAGQLPTPHVFQVEDGAGQVPAPQAQQLADDTWQLQPPMLQPQIDDSAGQVPPTLQAPSAIDDVNPGIEDLRAQVAELTKAVYALQQGMTA